jgi:hypothetical protein
MSHLYRDIAAGLSDEEMHMCDEQRDFLQEQIEAKYKWFNRGSRFWSAAHHWSLGISAVLSTMSVLVLKLGFIQDVSAPLYRHRDDLAALLAGAAAMIAALAASGGFGRKWQSNRISRGRIERLRLDLYSPDADLAKIRDQLKDVIRTHDESIVGSPLKSE